MPKALPQDAVSVTGKYVGDRAFSYVLRKVLGDESAKELVIYENTTVLEKIIFAAGTGVSEVDALIAAGNASSSLFDFAKAQGYTGEGKLPDNVTGQLGGNGSGTLGSNPSSSNDMYSKAFVLLEPYRWNTICVDTDSTEVHNILSAYMQRVYQGGKMGFAVVGEPVSVELDTRMDHSKAFNQYTTVYVGGGWINSSGATGGRLHGSRQNCGNGGFSALKSVPHAQTCYRSRRAGRASDEFTVRADDKKRNDHVLSLSRGNRVDRVGNHHIGDTVWRGR